MVCCVTPSLSADQGEPGWFMVTTTIFRVRHDNHVQVMCLMVLPTRAQDRVPADVFLPSCPTVNRYKCQGQLKVAVPPLRWRPQKHSHPGQRGKDSHGPHGDDVCRQTLHTFMLLKLHSGSASRHNPLPIPLDAKAFTTLAAKDTLQFQRDRTRCP